MEFLLFSLDDQRYGLRLESVERVIHMVKVTKLPLAPDIISGIIDLHGTIVPVYDPRIRFRFSIRPNKASDSLIIANTGKCVVALAVEKIEGIVSINQELEKIESSLSGTPFVEGAVRAGSGLILIYDLSLFITPDEEENVKQVINDWKEKNS